MRSRLWVALFVLLVLLTPCQAHADEMKSTDTEDIVMLEGSNERAVVTPLTAIQGWFNNVRFTIESYGTVRLNQLNRAINRLFTYRTFNVFFVASIALVYFWWGVRKVIRMLFRAFRKGKANV